jgi:1-acyl-sn-glycerol-3-phosphate acyltransferase
LLFYRSVRGLFRILAVPMFRFRVVGCERVPMQGPAVVVAPHRSWLDPACVGGACPRPVRFLILDTVYRRVWARWFYRGMCGIPVRVGGGPETMAGLRDALRALRAGQVVGVFPEGRTMPEGPLQPLHAGAALLSVRGRAPVIPMVIRGSAKAWPRGRRWPGPAAISVHVGHAIPPPSERGREAVEHFLVRIEAALKALSESVDGR